MKLSQLELSKRKTKARARGEKRYLGNLCKIHPELNGERVIWSGCCVECNRTNARLRMRKWTAQNPERASEISNRSKEKNRERILENERKKYQENPEHYLAKHKRYRDKPEVRNRLRKKALQWAKQNKGRRAASQTKRRSRQSKSLLSIIYMPAIHEFYEQAQKMTESTGIAHHVDHIVPLKGRGVCGLHVPWNLQILEAEKNISKYNKWSEKDATALIPLLKEV